MAKLNENIINLDDKDIFLNVINMVNKYKLDNPDADILSLGVGDVSLPIIKPVIEAMHLAVDDLSRRETFKGYDTSFGSVALKEAILKNEYGNFNFGTDEIYISDGVKSDCTSILELFDIDSKICVTNAMYPVYKAGAACLNRKVTVLEADEDNNFMPNVPKEKYDIIYICSPSNPTGICYTYDELKKWVEYAMQNEAIILYDNVYMPFISSKDVPKSIYEIEGAKKVAIEFRSFSKLASFSGVRCSYYIIPNEIDKNINKVWKKRTINRFNGTSYIAQKGALAIYTEEAQIEIKKNIAYYKENAKLLRDFFLAHGYIVYGGIDAPYVWVKIKENMTSWELFDLFLNKLNIVIIPGIIFGTGGDEYFRLSGLGTKETVEKAIKRMEEYYEKES